MATITLKGTAIQTAGSLPKVGAKAPALSLTGGDLIDIGLEKFLKDWEKAQAGRA